MSNIRTSYSPRTNYNTSYDNDDIVSLSIGSRRLILIRPFS